MLPKYFGVFLGILCGHGALIAFNDVLPEVIAPAVAGTVYLPLWLLQTVGLPVFSRGGSGGWSGPSILGWVLVAAIWATLWWGLVWVIAKVCARLGTR